MYVKHLKLCLAQSKCCPDDISYCFFMALLKQSSSFLQCKLFLLSFCHWGFFPPLKFLITCHVSLALCCAFFLIRENHFFVLGRRREKEGGRGRGICFKKTETPYLWKGHILHVYLLPSSAGIWVLSPNFRKKAIIVKKCGTLDKAWIPEFEDLNSITSSMIIWVPWASISIFFGPPFYHLKRVIIIQILFVSLDFYKL